MSPAATRRVRLGRALACAVTALTSLAAVAACGAGVPRPVPVQVLSNYEKNGNTVRRDCGYSSPLPGRPGWSLWLFCDTVIASDRGGNTERLILGTDTAAAGPYRAGHAPSRLSEIPTPPAPLASQQVLGSPVFTGDGYLYLFGFCPAGPAPAGCGRGRVFAVRTVAQPAYWQNPLTYQYWTGEGWSPDAAAARTLLPAAHPFGISVGDYTADGHGLVMVEQTSLAGGFQVWQASSPAGPWRRIITGQAPCRRGAQRGPEGLCRAVIGHPELSTRGKLVISYFDPGNYHVDVSAYPWLSP